MSLQNECHWGDRDQHFVTLHIKLGIIVII